MKLNTNMPAGLIPFYREELRLAKKTFAESSYQLSWRHLERAHIIAQPYPAQHTAVHWKMLVFGIKLKNGKEITGQLPRLLLGGVKSFMGKIPAGNTGGADVPPLKPMEIPPDLQEIINSHQDR